MICPSNFHCAYKASEAEDLSTLTDYMSIWNLLDYPSGIVPVTEVLEGEDQKYNDNYNDFLTTKIRNTNKGSVGMPIGVQVVTRQWKDEECLAVMKLIDNEVRFRKRPNLA